MSSPRAQVFASDERAGGPRIPSKCWSLALSIASVQAACSPGEAKISLEWPPLQPGLVWLLTGDRLEAMPSPPDHLDILWVTKAKRIFISTLQGYIYELIDKQWVEAASLSSRVSVTYESSRGLLIGLPRRDIALLHPSLGLCVLPLRDFGAVRFINPIEGGLVLTKNTDLLKRLGGNRVSVLLW